MGVMGTFVGSRAFWWCAQFSCGTFFLKFSANYWALPPGRLGAAPRRLPAGAHALGGPGGRGGRAVRALHLPPRRHVPAPPGVVRHGQWWTHTKTSREVRVFYIRDNRTLHSILSSESSSENSDVKDFWLKKVTMWSVRLCYYALQGS